MGVLHVAGDHGASYGRKLYVTNIFEFIRSNAISHYTTRDLKPTLWTEQISTQLSSTQSVFRACVGWVFELGINSEMPFFEKKNLALINAGAFLGLLLALPGTFVLILMGFGHPFSLLIGGTLAACLILGFNGSKRVEWSKALFAFTPALFILSYTLAELSSAKLDQPLNYFLARQGLCFALLIPMVIYGFAGRQKVTVVLGICVLMYLLADVGSMHLGAFQDENITGLSHGLFLVVSLLQYTSLAGCVLYIQNYSLQHLQQVQLTNDNLKSMAIRDGLTGLYNRRFMVQMIGDAINRSKRSGNPVSLLMVDVDFFKQVNDTYGHNAGDEVLVGLTRLLTSSKRSTDYLGRWGGDELILLLTDTNLAGADNLAGKLRTRVESQVFPCGKRLTISLGVSEYRDGDNPTTLVERADAALYRAKRAGRNKVELASINNQSN